MSDTGSLVVHGAVKSDTGDYVCVAQNLVGTRESQVARLSVHGESASQGPSGRGS